MRKILILVFIVSIFSFGVVSVHAKATSTSFGETKSLAGSLTDSAECTALLGDPGTEGSPAYYLQKVLDIVKYVGIALCIVLTIVDFFKAIVSDDKDLLKPLTKKALKRLVYAALLFFLPIIVNMILTLIDVYGTCGIS